MNVALLLERWADETPDAFAIIDERTGRSCTYAELRLRAAAMADECLRARLVPGDRVLVAVRMSLDLYVALIAIWRCGLVAVVPDASAGREQIERAIDLVRPQALIVEQRLAPLALLLGRIRAIPNKFVIGHFPMMRSLSRTPTARVVPACTPRAADDPALLTFTSGSTGIPKAAMRTHAMLRAQLRALLEDVRLGETGLETMPIVALANLAAGGTCVIPGVNLRAVGEADPDVLAATVARHRCTVMIASPIVLRRMADRCSPNDIRLRSLAHVYSGGAPVFPTVLDAFARVAPDAQLYAVYGSTEAEPIAHLALRDIRESDRERMRSGAGLLVGRVVAATDIGILYSRNGEALGPFTPDAFRSAVLGLGSPGEIVVAGEHVIPGYLDGVGDSETKVRVGDRIYHRTGDIGRLEADGTLWLLGRAGAVIEDAHGTLYPLSVECCASFAAGVRRSALAHARGHRTLFVEGTQWDRADLQSRLGWAMLDRIEKIAAIPVDRRHNAKVDYAKLSKLA